MMHIDKNDLLFCMIDAAKGSTCEELDGAYLMINVVDGYLNEDCSDNGWIDITKRMPRPGDRVLVCDDRFVGEGYLTQGGLFRRYDGTYLDSVLNRGVTHWMPLPEPPEC